MISQEKRQFERSDTCLIVEFRPFNQEDGYSLGITSNVSSEGFSFESQHNSFHPGNVLEFNLKHPYSDISVTASGEIVWKIESGDKLISGIKLNGAGQVYQNRISTLISSTCALSDNTITGCSGRAADDRPINSNNEIPQNQELPLDTKPASSNSDPSEAAVQRKKYIPYAAAALSVAMLFMVLSMSRDKIINQKQTVNLQPLPAERGPAENIEAIPVQQTNGTAEESIQKAHILTILSGGSFLPGQTVVDNRLINDLDKIVPDILASPDHAVVIDGHTSSMSVTPSTGTQYEINIDLSLARAKAVASILVNKGIPAERISVNGYGDTRSIASNETSEGRAKNRRVVIKLIPADSTL